MYTKHKKCPCCLRVLNRSHVSGSSSESKLSELLPECDKEKEMVSQLQVIKNYKYITDRGSVYLVKLRVATAMTGEFEEIQNSELVNPLGRVYQDYPMPQDYMRYVTVKVPNNPKTQRIPMANSLIRAFAFGGRINVVTPDGTVSGYVINSFGERWDHSRYLLDDTDA